MFVWGVVLRWVVKNNLSRQPKGSLYRNTLCVKQNYCTCWQTEFDHDQPLSSTDFTILSVSWEVQGFSTDCYVFAFKELIHSRNELRLKLTTHSCIRAVLLAPTHSTASKPLVAHRCLHYQHTLTFINNYAPIFLNNFLNGSGIWNGYSR